MTCKLKIEHMGGNKAVAVTDANGNSYGTLEHAGRSVEVTVSSGVSFNVAETGDFLPPPSTMGGEPGSNVPDERIED